LASTVAVGGLLGSGGNRLGAGGGPLREIGGLPGTGGGSVGAFATGGALGGDVAAGAVKPSFFASGGGALLPSAGGAMPIAVCPRRFFASAFAFASAAENGLVT
jgi:hypothetical protein